MSLFSQANTRKGIVALSVLAVLGAAYYAFGGLEADIWIDNWHWPFVGAASTVNEMNDTRQLLGEFADTATRSSGAVLAYNILLVGIPALLAFWTARFAKGRAEFIGWVVLFIGFVLAIVFSPATNAGPANLNLSMVTYGAMTVAGLVLGKIALALASKTPGEIVDSAAAAVIRDAKRGVDSITGRNGSGI